VERDALVALKNLRLVKPHKVDCRFLMCPYCQLQRCQVIQTGGLLVCQCPDCGAIPVDEVDRQAWTLDVDVLIRKLRVSLDISIQQATVAITTNMWQIGIHQRHPVILARSLDRVLQKPSLLGRVRNGATPWLLTPKPLRDQEDDPLAGAGFWLPLEERFALYGGQIRFIAPGTAPEVMPDNTTEAVNGPFSADFRWVRLAGDNSAIALSPAQGEVFRILWQLGGQGLEGHMVMSRAKLSSAKPIDVFKVQSQNKNKPEYEEPLRAYKTLVSVTRAGIYAMHCAAQKSH